MKLEIALKGKEKELRVSEEDRFKIMKLGNISNQLHTLNCDLYNYFASENIEMPKELESKMESMIDMVDSIYVDEAVKNICKNAIIDGFTIEEFEKHFDELCHECDVEDSPSLIDCALDIFYEESKVYEAM